MEMPTPLIARSAGNVRPRIHASPRKKIIFLVQSGFRFSCPIRNALEERGFEVIHTESLDAALCIWARSVMSVDLFVADLSLQNDPGIERLAKLLQAENPHMRVLYVNGLDDIKGGVIDQSYPNQLATVVENCLG